MQNITFVNRLQYPLWIAATSVNIASFCLLTWLIVGIVVYGRRNDKFKHLKSSDALKKHGGIVYLSSLVAVAHCYTVLIINVAYYNAGFGNNNSRGCEIIMDTVVPFYKLSAFLILMYYWLRQRALYRHQVMADLAQKKRVTILNWATLAFMIFGFGLETLAFVIPNQATITPYGCGILPDLTIWPLYLGIVVFLTSQIFLFFLFIYPLRQHSKRQEANRRNMNVIFRRNAVLIVLNIVSSVISLAFPVAIPFGHSIHGPEMWFEINLMFLAFCIVLSFKEWRRVLWPCGQTPFHKNKLISTNATATSNL